MPDTPTVSPPAARFAPDQARALARDLFGVDGEVATMPSYLDENFKIGAGHVLKIANVDEPREVLELQNAAMDWLHEHGQGQWFQRALPSTSGEKIVTVRGPDGQDRQARVVTFLPGKLMADLGRHDDALLQALGRFLGRMDAALEGLEHAGGERSLVWDLTKAGWIREHTHRLKHPARRDIVEAFLERFDAHVVPVLGDLRRSLIHNDANDYNVLVDDTGRAITGLLDFGDMVRSCTICELAIAVAYAILDKHDPLHVAEQVIGGYHTALRLERRELDVLFDLICMRLCVSVTMSARRSAEDPDNEYLLISERPAWIALEQLSCVDPVLARARFYAACGLEADDAPSDPRHERLRDARERSLGTALSLSYRRPLKIVRGSMQYLFDDMGRAYLDCVNNVCHVGHCHPDVVAAGQRQVGVLNTNTRYLHDTIVAYAQRLVATMPDPLSVCYLVCTGSEANELALRMARAHTGGRDMVVVDGAYHGNTGGLVDISPYKFDGSGGAGAPAHVHVTPTPDVYRNPLKADRQHAGRVYADDVGRRIAALTIADGKLAGFICESVMSCAGQIVLPEDYLRRVYAHVHAAGGVCIADEVQIGFGRVGTHMWGFETQGVVPDIVTLGKPIGNGHPLAAVITTPDIAAAFDNGMEYFNTFGGNPVSCAVGMAVLDVIEREGLRQRALEVGAHLKAGLVGLRERHAIVGDVRGLGLFLGVELVRDRATLEPAAKAASNVVERLRERGFLVSTDGPLHNVLKLKPPLQFSREDADRLVAALDDALAST